MMHLPDLDPNADIRFGTWPSVIVIVAVVFWIVAALFAVLAGLSELLDR